MAKPPLGVQSVADVAVRFPKTMGPETTVADARAAFDDDHVHMLLLTDHDRLLGTVVPSDLPGPEQDDVLALGIAALEGRTVSRHLPAETARRLLLGTGQRRLAVVDDGGGLLGLLCLKRRLTGFCSDADIAARAANSAFLQDA